MIEESRPKILEPTIILSDRGGADVTTDHGRSKPLPCSTMGLDTAVPRGLDKTLGAWCHAEKPGQSQGNLSTTHVNHGSTEADAWL
jgi:hypothetical protein